MDGDDAPERLAAGGESDKPDQVGMVVFAVVGGGQPFARDIELEAVEALGFVAASDAFEGCDQMTLTFAGVHHFKAARAVPGRERPVARHGKGIFGEGPELDGPAYAMRGADPGDADPSGHQQSLCRGAREKPCVSKHEAPIIAKGLKPISWRLRPAPCAPCAARPFRGCCASRAS